MATLILPCGISGSGKSRLYDTFISKDTVLVCPDDIRREVNGNISDQRNGKKIFEIAYKRIIEALKNNKDVYFSATNLIASNTIDLLKMINSILPNRAIKVLFYVLSDSFNPELCYERIVSDLSNNVDRSDVPKDVIMKQFQRFKSIVDNLENGNLKDFLEKSNIQYTIEYV